MNPHYRSMGGLYGSEYWTYLLPRRVGPAKAIELTQACQPIGTRAAFDIGLLDGAFCDDVETFEDEIRTRAASLANSPDLRAMLIKKHERRLDDELTKPLSSYRSEELAHMKVNFFGPDPAYHDARRRFVFKGNPPPPLRERAASQIKIGASVRANEAQQPPRDRSSSSGLRQASGFPHLTEAQGLRARPSDSFGARVLKVLRQGIGALPSWRDQ